VCSTGAYDTRWSAIDLIAQERRMREWLVQLWPALAGLVVGYRCDDGRNTEHATIIAFVVMLAGARPKLRRPRVHS
jgi:hypothetical protein